MRFYTQSLLKLLIEVILACLCFCSITAWSKVLTIDNSPEGFHWYNDPSEVMATNQTRLPTNAFVTTMAQMTALRHLVRAALDQVILYPSVDHATRYLALNNLLTQNASNFALTLQAARLLHPEMDYSLKHPTQNAARQQLFALQRQRMQQDLTQLAKTEGMWFFYRGANPLDQLMAKTVMSVARQYHFSTVGVSIDGRMLPIFPVNRQDHGQAKQFQVKAIPALLLVNPHTHQVQPVAYGVLSESQLLQRLAAIANSQLTTDGQDETTKINNGGSHEQ